MSSDINTTHILYRLSPIWFHPYISLGRMDRPIGYMLLFYPCIWGLLLGVNISLHTGTIQSIPIQNIVVYTILFFIGSVVMRSAGCAWNDIQDQRFDAQVVRTKNRPLPSGQISTIQAYVYIVILLILGLGVISMFPMVAVISAFVACIPALLYPFFKRITYFPQLFLGIAFNWGIWVGWFSILPTHVSLNSQWIWMPLGLHILGILWTLAYDTVYAHQDRADDILAGVKSSAIALGESTFKILYICYSMIAVIFVFMLYTIHVNFLSYTGVLGMYILSIVWIYTLDINSPDSCKKFFRNNRYLGLAICIVFAISII